MDRLKNAFLHIKFITQTQIDKIRRGFSFRAFLMIMFGILIYGANVALFVLSSMYAFNSFDAMNIIPFFVLGLIGVLFSGVLMFFVTLSLAAGEDAKMDMKGGGMFVTALKKEGKQKAKSLALAIFVYTFVLAGIFGCFGYYVGSNQKYNSYVSIEATVISTQDVNGMAVCTYEYIVGETEYHTPGRLKSSGAATPNVGDKVTIRYNPENPYIIYLENENRALIPIGTFFVYILFLLICFELLSSGLVPAKLFISIAMLGISAVCIAAAAITRNYTGAFDFLQNNLWLFFVFVFLNVGLMELLSFLINIGKKKIK